MHQEIRLKRFHFNETLMAYMRNFIREDWWQHNHGTGPSDCKLMLSEVIDLDFELVCLSWYEAVVTHMIQDEEKQTTLEEDQEMLKRYASAKENPGLAEGDTLTLKEYFAILYRSERKTTMRAQLEMVRYV